MFQEKRNSNSLFWVKIRTTKFSFKDSLVYYMDVAGQHFFFQSKSNAEELNNAISRILGYPILNATHIPLLNATAT